MKLQLWVWMLLLSACTQHEPPASPAADSGTAKPAPDAKPEPAAGSGGRSAPAPSPAGATSPRVECQPTLGDLAVSGADRAGYPPYAANGCSLLYVASDGALHLRSLASDDDQLIAPAEEEPTRPALAGPEDEPARVIAWESARDLSVRVRFAGETRVVRGDYARSAQPRASADAVVLSGFRDTDLSSDADVLLYEPASQRLSVVGGGSGQQQFPDVSATQVAYSDFAEDPDQRFDDDGMDLADIVVVDRATLTRQTLAQPGKQAFPLFGSDGSVVYLHWDASHPEPKLSAYAIMAYRASSAQHVMLAQVTTQPPYVRPSVYGSTVEWVERPFSGDERLMRLDMSDTHPRAAFSQPGTKLYATASSANATLMATLSANQTIPVLRAIAR